VNFFFNNNHFNQLSILTLIKNQNKLILCKYGVNLCNGEYTPTCRFLKIINSTLT